MSFKHLAIRAKKSLSGIYSLDKTLPSSPEEKSNKCSVTLNENVSPTSETFGSCPVSPSPSKDSPSKRKRLLGSLRSMGSLRSLRSHSNKQCEEPEVQAETPRTPTRESPSLALNFEVSPPGQAFFDPNSSRSSPSSLLVHHSSPITVPFAGFHAVPTSSPDGLSKFQVGTLPESPAPLRKAFEKETAMGEISPALIPLPIDESPFYDTNPTPMPGTHLPLGFITPGITVSSPSTKSLRSSLGYFDIPTNSEVHNADEHPTTPTGSTTVTIVEMNSDPKPPPGRLGPLRSKEDSMQNLSDDPLVLDGQSRKSRLSDSSIDNIAYIIWDECLGYEASTPSTSSTGAHQLERRRSIWGRHAGLYDGTGYGDDNIVTGQRASPSVDSDVHDNEKFSPEEILKDDMRLLEKSKPISVFLEENESGIDEREALDEVIRAYAFPMLYCDEAKEEQGAEFDGTVSEEEAAVGITAKTKAEVALSIRVMNRSLGG